MFHPMTGVAYVDVNVLTLKNGELYVTNVARTFNIKFKFSRLEMPKNAWKY